MSPVFAHGKLRLYLLALLSEGRIVMQGTPQEFLDSTNPKVREFLERDFDNPTLAA